MLFFLTNSQPQIIIYFEIEGVSAIATYFGLEARRGGPSGKLQLEMFHTKIPRCCRLNQNKFNTKNCASVYELKKDV